MATHHIALNVDELMAGEYKAPLAALRGEAAVAAAVAQFGPENEARGVPVDDLFLLRFLMSHKKDIPKAADAVVRTLAWRHDNMAKIDLLRDAPGAPPTPIPERMRRLPGLNLFSRFSVAGYHKTTALGGPIFVVRGGLSNSAEAVKHLPREQIIDIMVFSKEIGFEVCDRLTRQTRTLVKMAFFMDTKGISFATMPCSAFRSIQQEASHRTELFYPQLAGCMMIFNLPAVLRVVMQGILKLMPASMQEKVVVCSGNTQKGDASKCPHATVHGIPLENIPTFLGGRCACGELRGDWAEVVAGVKDHAERSAKCPGHCLGGIPNYWKVQVPGLAM